jgi:hypothetical protein
MNEQQLLLTIDIQQYIPEHCSGEKAYLPVGLRLKALVRA